MGRGQYNADYESKLIDDLLPPWSMNYKRAELANRQELNAVMDGTARMQAPFSDLDVRHQSDFIRKSHAATTEPKWVHDAFPYIMGTAEIAHEQGVLFNNFAPIGKRLLAQAKPDYYEGSSPSEIKQGIRDNLSEFIIPSTTKQRPMLPNLFFEAKGPTGIPTVAKLQACHDGALGARAIHQLRSYGKDPEAMYDGNAYTVTATYNEGALAIYAHHPTSSSGYRTQETEAEITTAYHMNRLGTWLLDDDIDGYRKGITAFRNLRVWAEEQRDQFIAEANCKIPKPYIAAAREVPELAQIASRVPDGERENVLDDEESEDDEEGSEEEADEESEEDDKESDEGADEQRYQDNDERQNRKISLSSAKKRTNLQPNRDIPSAKRRYSDSDDEDFDDELGHTPPKSVGKRPKHG